MRPFDDRQAAIWIAFAIGSVFASACGAHIAQMGILVNHIGMSRELLGPAPPGVYEGQFADPDHLRRSGYARLKRADVLGDEAVELLVELRAGAGHAHGGVEIRDESGRTLIRVLTKHYLTDFGAVRSSRTDKMDLVLCEYPTAMRPHRQSTFSILTLPDQQLVATWDEVPPACTFAAGVWNGHEALFYFQGDALTIRSRDGQLLRRIYVRNGNAFRDIHVGTTAGGYTAVLGSGDGYTPFHTVCLFDSNGQLVFQDIEKGHAVKLETDEEQSSWQIWDRVNRWGYKELNPSR
jgi:hypothetical protein